MKAKIARNPAGSRMARFHCPGCDAAHSVFVDGPHKWAFNESLAHPTFSPSVLVTYNGPDAGIDGAPHAVCHSFVTDGRIAYCNDSTHALSGQTVELPELE